MSDPYYRTREWRELRSAALARDHYTCVVPGCGASATHVDHIKRRRDGGADALPNLRSLCATHDGQVKEQSNGARGNKGRFRLIGCGADGWPLARTGG
jgi:5-methylcytosine-specific restriction endonuclease McrA